MAKSYKEKFREEDGVWRTIGGRRVFIRKGQSLSDAMKESGKFKTKITEQEKQNIQKNSEKPSINTITQEEYDKMPKDYKGTLKELVDTAEFRGENKEELRTFYEKQGYDVDKDKTILKYNNGGTVLQPVKISSDIGNKEKDVYLGNPDERPIPDERGGRIDPRTGERFFGKTKKEEENRLYGEQKLRDIENKYETDYEFAKSRHIGFGSFNKDGIPVYDGKIDNKGDFGWADLSKLSDEELRTALNVQSEEYHNAVNEKLGDQRTRNGKMDKIFNTAKQQKYEEGMNKLNEEINKRDLPRYNIYDDNGMVRVSSPTKEMAEKQLAEMYEIDKNLQKSYGWKDLPKYSIKEGKVDEYLNERKGNDYLPKASKVMTPGTSNRKEVSDNIQAHILEYYDNPVDFMEQMDAMDYLPTRWKQGEEIAKGGSYLVYNEDMADYLDSLNINPKGKKFSEDKSFDMYTSLIGRESERLYNRLEKLFEQYKKEHKGSNVSLDDFRKWFK